MRANSKLISVSQAASLCGVAYSTVGHWIREKKLFAHRVGKRYSIPMEEFLFFLQSTGQDIPDELADVNSRGPCCRPFQDCWQYFQDTANGHNCKECLVLKNMLTICFTGKTVGSLECSQQCTKCQYYLETYFPRIQFIHQISFPAAVYKDFHIWGGNSRWAELCGFKESDLPGMGVEHIFHPDSLETVISNIKRRTLGDPSVKTTYNVFFKNSENGKSGAQIYEYPLDNPSGTFLIFAELEREG